MSNSQSTGMNKLLLFVALILMCFGIVAIYSVSAYVAVSKGFPTEHYLQKHLVHLVIAVVVLMVFSKIDYALWKVSSRFVFTVGAVLTLGTIIMGIATKGAARWIMNIQPSEIMKFGFIAWVCTKLSNAGDEIKTLKCSIIQPAIPMVISGILLALQPNYSMLIIFCGVLLVLLLVAGANLKYIGLSILAAVPTGLLVLLTSSHSRKRIDAFFAPTGEMTASQHQGMHAVAALGNGGVFGTGVGMGEEKLGYLPESFKDMIYAAVGEEFGFIGTAIILVAFAMLFSQGFNIARDSSTRFGKYLAVALSTSLFMNFVIHVCVCVGLIPVTGQPLPFISYGGTNLIMSAAFIGILLNISRSTTGKSIREPYMSSSMSYDSGRSMNFGARRSSI